MSQPAHPTPACELCGDQEPLLLQARCHLTAPLQATYDNGILTLRCYLPECRREVARFSAILLGSPLVADILRKEA